MKLLLLYFVQVEENEIKNSIVGSLVLTLNRPRPHFEGTDIKVQNLGNASYLLVASNVRLISLEYQWYVHISEKYKSDNLCLMLLGIDK